MNKAFILTFLFFQTHNTYAEMTALNKGQVAPYEGILVDAEQMKEFRKINEDKKSLELENLKLKDLSIINDQRIDLYKTEVKRVTEDLSRSEKKAFWQSAGTFVLGVIVTGFAAKVAIEATR